MSHTYSECRRAAGAVEECLLADGLSQSLHVSGGYRKSPATDRRHCRFRQLPDDSSGTVDRKINSRLQYACGDSRHDRDQRFGHHCAISDHARFTLTLEQLGRGATGDQSMKPADSTAGNRNEGKGKYLSREDRAGAVDKAGEWRHVERGPHGNDPKRQ